MVTLVTSDLEDVTEFILDDAHLINPVITEDADLPDAPSFCEAMAGPEHDKWHQAILEELTAIKEAGTWELVDSLPNIRNIVGCSFVLQKKCSADSNVPRYNGC